MTPLVSRLGVVLAAVLLTTTGCNGAATEEERVANQDLVDEIATRIDARDDVTDIEATYADDATASAQVAAEVRCERCDGDRVGQAVVKAVWKSTIAPLGSITILVTGARAGTSSSTRVILPRDEQATVALYGERPVESILDEE